MTANGWLHIVLPAVTLAIFQLSLIKRLVRAEMLEVLRTDYTKFARARGLSNRAIHFGHALKITLVTVLTITGLQLGGLIADDLRDNFWYEEAHVIANSFGAYLFYHAQCQMEPYVGKVILLSPIVGEFGNEESKMHFIPPRSEKLFQLARDGRLPIPKHCEIHVGAEYWQSNLTNVKALGAMLGIDVAVVPNAGHMLPKEYVGDVLDKWLN